MVKTSTLADCIPDTEAIAGLRRIDPSLSARQAAIYLFIFNHSLTRGWQPSVRELGEVFGIASLNGVACHLTQLAAKGWVEAGRNVARSVTFLRTPSGEAFIGFQPKRGG